MSQKLHHHPPTPLTPWGWFPGCWSWTLAGEINYFAFRITKWCESECCSMDSWRPCGLRSPWKSPGQNTRVGSLSLLHGVFPTQGLDPGFPHCRWILYQLSHQWCPRILEWVAHPFSRGSSWPRNWIGVSRIADSFFTNWAIREAQWLMRKCFSSQKYSS